MQVSEQNKAVDVWANYWTAEFFADHQPERAVYDKLGLTGQVTDLDALAEEASEIGLTKVIMSATAVSEASDNAATARAIARYPELLVGCASVDPTLANAGSELQRTIDEFGFRAFKVLPFLHGLPPNDPRYDSLYEICIEHRIPVLFLTGHQATQVPSEIGQPAHVDDVALRYPELTIIAGPGGWPWVDELIALAWKHPNLYFHTVWAPPPWRDIYFPPQVLTYMDVMGANKVMWGTGYPFMGHRDALAEIRGGAIDADIRDGLLWGNAARVWGWD